MVDASLIDRGRVLEEPRILNTQYKEGNDTKKKRIVRQAWVGIGLRTRARFAAPQP